MTTVGVIGAGTMGSGIARAFADAGHETIVVDTDPSVLEGSRRSIGAAYDTLRERGRISASEAGRRLARIGHAAELAAAARCPLIIEAVFESLLVKQDVFARLSAVCGTNTILATNTSTLDVDAIAAVAQRPERCLGMHFFSPAHAMKLVEVVRAAGTTRSVLDAVCSTARAIGKTPVVVANADGFVGNRMLLGYRREAEFLVLEGASPRAVDAALEAFGFAMGPFAVSDLAGIDVGVLAKRERAARGAAPAFALTRLPDRLVEAGRLGRKSGVGYYRYPPGDDASDPELDAIIAEERTRLRLTPRDIEPDEIVERCLTALTSEGGRILDAGIAQTADDIDLIWRLGYGFPAARGGPIAYAASLGFKQIAGRIEYYARRDPVFWSIAPYIKRRAEEERAGVVGS